MTGPGGGLSANVDDFYICDNSGSRNNGFLGPIRIYAEVPVANGSPLQWTPSAGQNYAIVAAIPPNTLQNVSSSTVGQTDQYVYHDSDIPVGSLVFGVQHVICAQLGGAGARSIASDVNGNIGSSNALSSSEHMITAPYDTNPATGNQWSLSDFPGTEFGPTVTA
jgi:hypothetical protein